MNPSSVFSVLGECLSCGLYDRITYAWSLYLQDSFTDMYEEVGDLDILISSGKTGFIVRTADNIFATFCFIFEFILQNVDKK